MIQKSLFLTEFSLWHMPLLGKFYWLFLMGLFYVNATIQMQWRRGGNLVLILKRIGLTYIQHTRDIRMWAAPSNQSNFNQEMQEYCFLKSDLTVTIEMFPAPEGNTSRVSGRCGFTDRHDTFRPSFVGSKNHKKHLLFNPTLYIHSPLIFGRPKLPESDRRSLQNPQRLRPHSLSLRSEVPFAWSFLAAK